MNANSVRRWSERARQQFAVPVSRKRALAFAAQSLAGLEVAFFVALRLIGWIDTGNMLMSLPETWPKALQLLLHPLAPALMIVVIPLAITYRGYLEHEAISVPDPDLCDSWGFLVRKRNPYEAPLKFLRSTIVAGALVAGSVYGYYRFLKTPIGSTFSVAYDRFQRDLGLPERKPTVLQGLRYQRYENANILWVDDGREDRFYVLRTQPLPQLFRVHDDNDLKNECGWESENWLRSNVRTCEGLKPPSGGVAKLYRQHPPSWNWIGCLEWERWYGAVPGYGESTLIQNFTGGAIIGPVNLGEDRPTEWEVFVLLNSRTEEYGFAGHWRFVRVDASIPHPKRKYTATNPTCPE